MEGKQQLLGFTTLYPLLSSSLLQETTHHKIPKTFLSAQGKPFTVTVQQCHGCSALQESIHTTVGMLLRMLRRYKYVKKTPFYMCCTFYKH